MFPPFADTGISQSRYVVFCLKDTVKVTCSITVYALYRISFIHTISQCIHTGDPHIGVKTQSRHSLKDYIFQGDSCKVI